jgi:hypothetical protein
MGRNFERPEVMAVMAVAECNNETGVGNSFHLREKPFRDDRSLGPDIAPA